MAIDVYEFDRQLNMKVQLSSAPVVPVSVFFTVQSGSATANSDFRLSLGQILFLAGTISKVSAAQRSLRVCAGIMIHTCVHLQ